MSEPDYIADCTECELEERSDDYETVAEFKEKHEEHTDHEVEWTSNRVYDFEEVNFYEYHVDCSQCESERFITESAAEEYAEEHAEFTDHGTPKILKKEFEPEDRVPDVKAVVKALEEKRGDGVPEETILKYCSKIGMEIPEVRAELGKLKTRGEIYVPKKNHLRAI